MLIAYWAECNDEVSPSRRSDVGLEKGYFCRFKLVVVLHQNLKWAKASMVL